MLLTRWNPEPTTAPFQALSRELERMFDGFFGATPGPRARHVSPPLSISETDDAFEVQAELPGVLADDLDVSVRGNRVTLKGERKVTEREGSSLLLREWGGYEFERSFELPVDIDANGLKAELHDGILHLTVPKQPGHKVRKIKVLTK